MAARERQLMTLKAPTATVPIVAHRLLRGTPASMGEASGRARIVRRPVDAARIQRGDLVVCAGTDEVLPSVLMRAAGIVSETGGALSSPAIIARECKTPAVFNVLDATTKIRDGQSVTIDGATGITFLRD